jgi:phenylalanyl-tRNA synthetase beta chain
MPAFRRSPLAIRDRIRETLAGAGLSEVVSHALVSPEAAGRFAWSMETAPVVDGTAAAGRPIHVTNPLSADHSVLRPTVVGSLVEIAGSNIRRGRDDVAIFEIGKGYGDDNGVVREWWRLAIAWTGSADEPAWNQPARPVDLDDVKGAIELVCRRIGLAAPSYSPITDEPLLHQGRSASVIAVHSAGRREGHPGLAGVVGELHPGVADAVDLRGARLIVAEVDISGLGGGLGGGQPDDHAVTAPSRHPAAERDLAVVVPESAPAAAVERAIRSSAGDDLIDLRLFDVYRGAPLASTEKSLAWRLRFQAADRTLTDAEVDGALTAVTAALAAIGGRIRT